MPNFKHPFRHYLVIIGLFLSSCTQVDVSGLNPDQFTNLGKGGGSSVLCDGVTSDFSTDILPIFQSKCSGSSCHTSGGSGGQLNLDDSDQVSGEGASGVIGNIKGNSDLSLTTPAQSKLLLIPLATAEGGSGGSHPGGEIFKTTTDENYKKIYCWIDAGATNDLDDSNCTFGEHVYPIFAPVKGRGCAAGGVCHNSSHPNLDLSQDSMSVVSSTEPKSLFTADQLNGPVVTAGDSSQSSLLRYSLGDFSHKGGNVLGSTSDPDYQLIKCWIDEGAKNN